MINANMGWLFYKKYYHNINKDGKSNDYEQKTNQIINTQLTKTMEEIPGATIVELKTTYPGLLIGSGYQHETGGENEFKIGFYFDYSTGLPVIPGSSVKGALRSVFPFHRKDLGEGFRQPRIKYLIDKIKTIAQVEVDITRIEALELEIFEGKVLSIQNGEKIVEHLPLSNRDIFYDSFPSKSKNHNQRILDTDYITHHESPIKNPNPVMFLKVLPEVEFKLQFKTENSGVIPELTAKKKIELFKTIILELGLGAKTNVGYGQFVDVPKAKLNEEIEGELDSIDYKTNWYYFKTNLFGVVNAPFSKKLKNAVTGQHFILEIKSLNPDGTVKNISVKGQVE